MKKLIAFLILFISVQLTYSQRFEWIKTFASSSSNDVAVEVSGNNVYVAGEFRNSISFGSTVLTAPNANNQFLYIANYDTLGNFRWARSGGSPTSFADFRDFDVDEFGNVYIIGSYNFTIEWDTLTLNASGSSGSIFQQQEGFIVKIDSNGDAQWLEGVYSPSASLSSNSLLEISVADSSIYFGGLITQSISLTNSTLQLTQTSSQNDGYVGRLDLNGNFNFLDIVVNTNTTSGTSYNFSDLEAENDSTFYLSGSLRGSYDFGSNNRSFNSTSRSTFVSKFIDSTCSWLTSTTSTGGFTLSGPQIDLRNNLIYLGGTFSGSLTLQTLTINAIAGASIFTNYWFASTLNTNGVVQNLVNLNVPNPTVVDVASNANFEMYLIGVFSDSVAFNGLTNFSNGNNDLLVINLDSSLDVNWFQTGGGGNADNINSIATGNSTNAYALGNYRGLSQFGSSIFTGNSSSNTSILFKLEECGNASIPLSFLGDTNFCAGQNVRIQANPSATSTFQWLKDSIELSGETFRDLIIDSTGAYEVIVNGQGCVDTSRVVQVNVGTPPTVVLNLNDTVCAQDTAFVLSGGTPSGGFYRGPGVDSNMFDPSIAGIGNSLVTYIFSNGGCRDSASSNIFVKPTPSVFFAPINNICITSSPITLTNAFPFGGVFSGNGVSNGQFDPAIAGGGFHTITYTYTDKNGCFGVATQSIEVDTLPVTSFSSIPSVCENVGAFNLVGGSPSGGVYEGIGISNGVFDPSVSGVGTFNVNYILTNQCDSDTSTQTITVNPAPAVSLGLFSDVCEGSGLISLSGGTPSGGTYSGTGVSAGQFDPAVSGVGTFTIFYDFTNAIGCSSRDSSTIAVNSLPTTAITPDTAICDGSSIALNATGGTSYLWSNAATTSTITVSPTTTTQYFVTVTNASNCSQIDSVTVTVNPNPVAAISGTTAICEGSSTTLTASGGATYLWGNSSSNTSITVSPTVNTTYSVTVTDLNGCADVQSQLVTVNPAPAVSLGLFSDVCEGSGLITLSGGTPSGGTYSGTGVSAGQFDPAVSGVGTFTIFYDFTNAIGCSSRDSSTIAVNSLPTTAITPDTAICDGSSIALNATGGTSYLWSNAATTSTITVSPTTTTQYFVTVTNASNCSQIDSVTVSVNPNPVAAISGTTTICEGSSTTLTASGGTTYLWGNSSSNTSITVSPTVNTTYSVTVTDLNGCADVQSQLVTVNPAPAVSLGLFSDVCEGSGLITLSGGTPSGGTYSGTGVSAGQFDPAVSGVGTFTIFYDFTNAIGCSSRDSSTIAVNSLPTTAITPDTAICDGSSIALNATGGTSYLWSNAATTSTITVSPTTTTQYFVTVTNASNCSQIDSVTVSVNPNPVAAISGTTTICEGSSTTLTASGGATYLWGNSSSNTSITVSPTVNTTYSVTVTDLNGCADVQSQLVTVNPAPAVSLGLFSDVCEGSGLITLSGGTPSGGTYSGTGVSAGQFDPAVSGVGTFTIFYDFTNAIGCSSRDSSTIAVNSLPTTAITPDTAICDGSSIALNATGGTSYLWSNAATTSTITVSPTTTTQYFVTVTNASNCSQIDSVTVSVNPNPVLTTSNDTSICLGDTILISAQSNALNYLWNTNDTASSISVSPLNSRIYIVSSVNTLGCIVIDTINVTVNTGTPFNIGPDTTLNSVNALSYTYNAGSGFSSYLWQDNSTNQTLVVNYSPAKSGTLDTISVIVENASGCQSADTAIVFYDFNISLDNNFNDLNNVSVMPNPATEIVNIHFKQKSNSIKRVRIIDMRGKIVFDNNYAVQDKEISIDIDDRKMSKGVYLLNIEMDGKNFQEKIVVQ